MAPYKRTGLLRLRWRRRRWGWFLFLFKMVNPISYNHIRVVYT